MSGLLNPLTSWRYFLVALLSWGIPTAIATLLYVLFAFPSIQDIHFVEHLAGRVDELGVPGVWLFTLFCLAVTVLAWFSERIGYEFLEGYHWPEHLAQRRRQAHAAQRAHLIAEARCAGWRDDLASDLAAIGVALGDLSDRHLHELELTDGDAEESRSEYVAALEKLHQCPRPRRTWGLLEAWDDYPAEFHPTRATKLGNRIGALESYGETRWGFDSVDLYYHMAAVTDPEVATNEQEARMGVDVFVGATLVNWAAAVVGIATTGVALGFPSGGAPWPSLVLVAAHLVLAHICYARAVRQTWEWDYAFRALVDAARLPLCGMLGLAMPDSADKEREMWIQVNWELTRSGIAPPSDRDRFRSRPAPGLAEAISRVAHRLKD